MMQTQSTWLPRNLSHFWRRLRALTIKEFRQLIRDKSNLAIGIFLPIALILLFGYGLSLDIRNAPVAIVLEDGAPMARDVVAGLRGSDYIAPRYVTTMAEAEALMRGRQVDGIVRIPSDNWLRAEERYSLSSMERMQRRPPVFVVMCPQPLMDGTSAAPIAPAGSVLLQAWSLLTVSGSTRPIRAPGIWFLG